MTTTYRRRAPRPSATLTLTQLHALRAALHEQREFRIEQLAELTCTPAADSEPATEITTTLRAGARFALAQIEAALQRLSIGRFGICTGCDQPIAFERLEILPMAARCIQCQRRSDHQPGTA